MPKNENQSVKTCLVKNEILNLKGKITKRTWDRLEKSTCITLSVCSKDAYRKVNRKELT